MNSGAFFDRCFAISDILTVGGAVATGGNEPVVRRYLKLAIASGRWFAIMDVLFFGVESTSGRGVTVLKSGCRVAAAGQNNIEHNPEFRGMP